MFRFVLIPLLLTAVNVSYAQQPDNRTAVELAKDLDDLVGRQTIVGNKDPQELAKVNKEIEKNRAELAAFLIKLSLNTSLPKGHALDTLLAEMADAQLDGQIASLQKTINQEKQENLEQEKKLGLVDSRGNPTGFWQTSSTAKALMPYIRSIATVLPINQIHNLIADLIPSVDEHEKQVLMAQLSEIDVSYREALLKAVTDEKARRRK